MSGKIGAGLEGANVLHRTASGKRRRGSRQRSVQIREEAGKHGFRAGGVVGSMKVIAYLAKARAWCRPVPEEFAGRPGTHLEAGFGAEYEIAIPRQGTKIIIQISRKNSPNPNF